MASIASRFTRSVAVRAIYRNWRRFWRWWCAVDTADPVRRTLNQGFAILIGCFIPIAIVQFLVFLIYRKSPSDIVLMPTVLLLLVGCWWWNRRGAVRGTIVFIVLAMAAIVIFMPPSSYASTNEPVPLLFLVPIAVATLFITPRAGVAAYLGMYASLILAVVPSDVPAAVAQRYMLVVGIDLGTMTSILVLGAQLFTRALRQAAQSNAALQELNASLEQQVADRTAEIVAATAALARRDAARVRDISAVTHDLRNGLQRVQDALDMAWLDLLPGLHQPGPAALHHRRIQATITAVTDIASAMHDSMLLAYQRLDLAPQPTNLLTLATAVMQQFEASFRAASCRLVLAVDTVLPLAWCDEPRIRRVLANLLENALKYTRVRPGAGEGEVTLTLWADTQHVGCTIRDTGIGIAPEHIAELGQPFRRLDPVNAEAPGTGLGLSFCRAILAASGGGLIVSSDGLGMGTTVRVWLPRATAAMPDGANISTANPDSWAGRRVLVVEDDPATSQALRDALQARGAAVVRTDCAEEAQTWLRTETCDVAILDEQLRGELRGHMLARWMQAQPHLHATLRVAFSATPDAFQGPHAPLADVDLVLGKPLPIALMLAQIQPLLPLTAQASEAHRP